MTRRILALAVTAAFLTTACGGSDTAVAPRLRTVDAADFAAVVEDGPADLVILDVRTPEEFAAGHIAGAVNIDFRGTSFRSDLDGLDKDVPYGVYCRTGNRSGQTMQLMQELGFSDVTELSGGIVSWHDAGYPLER
jgi:phage shock protein E